MNSPEVKIEIGKMLAEGKTKQVMELLDQPGKVLIVSKDDITAGDGAKHDIIEGKSVFSTATTCNVFRLLKACGVSVAFDSRVGPRQFIADDCRMLPYEVVVRREAHGSYLKRAPYLAKGHIFSRLIVEFYLKTSGKKWKDHDLVCDDPLMIRELNPPVINLFNPKEPNLPQTPAVPFLALTESEVFNQGNEEDLIDRMDYIARHAFLILEKAWQLQGRKLVDFKVEFGINKAGKLLLADVIDNDSWRVLDGSGCYIDKQVYRDGGSLELVTDKYRQVAELTSQFMIPVQRLILWVGSEKDEVNWLHNELVDAVGSSELEKIVVCSMHKEPIKGLYILNQLVQEVPDSVIIAYIGMSNGAGPTISANTSVPVITVPAGFEKFPEDVWSSLRMPSKVPVMTILNRCNAVLAGLQILAMRNPGIYALLRMKQEDRLVDMSII